MKKILPVIAILACTLSTNAQETREKFQHKQSSNNKQHIQHHNKEMLKDINLSDAQKVQMKENREDFRSKMSTLNKQDNITVGELKAKKIALQKEQKEKRNNIFTPEQKKQLALNKANMQARRKEMKEKRVAEMQLKLGLNKDQAAKLKIQNENTQARVKAIKENELLSREEKKIQIRALKVASNEQRKNILTPDQLKKLEEFKKEKKGKDQNQIKK